VSAWFGSTWEVPVRSEPFPGTGEVKDAGVSKNRGTPKWIEKIMENPIKMDDLGGKPTICGNIHINIIIIIIIISPNISGT